MNPFDNLELYAFDKIMIKDMPHHTDTNIQIKNSYSQGLPKNLKSYSEKVDNKFLNDNLAIIEEMEHRKPNNKISKLFKSYQNKIYAKSGILNHDHFFDEFGLIKNTRYNLSLQDVGFVSSLDLPAVNGAEIEFGTGGTTSGSNGETIVSAYSDDLATLAVVNNLYDQIALKYRTGTSNQHIGCWDDDGTFADNLLCDTGSVANNSGYVYKSVTEFSMTTTKIWMGFQSQSAGWGHFDRNTSSSMKYKLRTFGSLPDPAGAVSGYTDNGIRVAVMKVGHT